MAQLVMAQALSLLATASPCQFAGTHDRSLVSEACALGGGDVVSRAEYLPGRVVNGPDAHGVGADERRGVRAGVMCSKQLHGVGVPTGAGEGLGEGTDGQPERAPLAEPVPVVDQGAEARQGQIRVFGAPGGGCEQGVPGVSSGRGEADRFGVLDSHAQVLGRGVGLAFGTPLASGVGGERLNGRGLRVAR